jgi:hypothetical protein
VKYYSVEEIARLIHKVDELFLEFDSMCVPDDDWHDLIDWVNLDTLVGYRNHLAYNYTQMAPDSIQTTFENMTRMYEDLVLQKRYLNLSGSEYSKGKKIIVAPEPAIAKATAHGPDLDALDKKRKTANKLSATKIITFCGYFFPKKFREEAKGDILETRYEMLKNGCSKTAIFIVTAFKIISLILGSLRIRLSDLVKPENEMNK